MKKMHDLRNSFNEKKSIFKEKYNSSIYFKIISLKVNINISLKSKTFPNLPLSAEVSSAKFIDPFLKCSNNFTKFEYLEEIG